MRYKYTINEAIKTLPFYTRADTSTWMIFDLPENLNAYSLMQETSKTPCNVLQCELSFPRYRRSKVGRSTSGLPRLSPPSSVAQDRTVDFDSSVKFVNQVAIVLTPIDLCYFSTTLLKCHDVFVSLNRLPAT